MTEQLAGLWLPLTPFLYCFLFLKYEGNESEHMDWKTFRKREIKQSQGQTLKKILVILV